MGRGNLLLWVSHSRLLIQATLRSPWHLLNQVCNSITHEIALPHAGLANFIVSTTESLLSLPYLSPIRRLPAVCEDINQLVIWSMALTGLYPSSQCFSWQWSDSKTTEARDWIRVHILTFWLALFIPWKSPRFGEMVCLRIKLDHNQSPVRHSFSHPKWHQLNVNNI